MVPSRSACIADRGWRARLACLLAEHPQVLALVEGLNSEIDQLARALNDHRTKREGLLAKKFKAENTLEQVENRRRGSVALVDGKIRQAWPVMPSTTAVHQSHRRPRSLDSGSPQR